VIGPTPSLSRSGVESSSCRHRETQRPNVCGCNAISRVVSARQQVLARTVQPMGQGQRPTIACRYCPTMVGYVATIERICCLRHESLCPSPHRIRARVHRSGRRSRQMGKGNDYVITPAIHRDGGATRRVDQGAQGSTPRRLRQSCQCSFNSTCARSDADR
jgi:hypothetical protein